MTTIGQRKARVVIGSDDPTLTPAAGLMMVAEVDRIVGVARSIDDWVGRIKQRNRGLSSGQLVVSMAESMLAGGDFMCDLDTLRADTAGAVLRAVPEAPAPSTFIALARRFDEATIGDLESAIGFMTRTWFAALPTARRRALAAVRPTLDLDPTDIEVYGSKKQGVAWNYAGQRAGRAHPTVWAEAGIVVAGELGSGTDDPRPQAPGLISRAVAALPEGLLRPRVRADAGFFDRKVAEAALAHGADFAIAARCNTAVWRSAAKLNDAAWQPAVGMAGAEVAVCDYRPGGWPEDTRTIVRRVRVEVAEVRQDPRSRRRRTIDPTQLALVLGGGADHAYAYSFLVTNLAGEPTEIEAWFRGRALVEERIKDSKCGLALRHLPSGYSAVNAVWMWSAFLALNLSVFCQSLAGIDTKGRAHAKRARRELFVVPARVLFHARRIVLRLSPVHHRAVPSGLAHLVRHPRRRALIEGIEPAAATLRPGRKRTDRAPVWSSAPRDQPRPPDPLYSPTWLFIRSLREAVPRLPADLGQNPLGSEFKMDAAPIMSSPQAATASQRRRNTGHPPAPWTRGGGSSGSSCVTSSTMARSRAWTPAVSSSSVSGPVSASARLHPPGDSVCSEVQGPPGEPEPVPRYCHPGKVSRPAARFASAERSHPTRARPKMVCGPLPFQP